MTDDYAKAKTCPFCGWRPRVGNLMMTRGIARPYVLYCYGEDHTAEAWGDTPEDCVKNWNAR